MLSLALSLSFAFGLSLTLALSGLSHGGFGTDARLGQSKGGLSLSQRLRCGGRVLLGGRILTRGSFSAGVSFFPTAAPISAARFTNVSLHCAARSSA